MKMKRKRAWLGFLGGLSCLGILFVQGCPSGGGGGGADKQKVVQLEARVTEIESILERVGLKPSSKPIKVPLANSPILGDKNATVSVVAIVDMECPFCGRVNPMLKQLVEDPQLKGKVNVVLKHFPLSFHKGATPAAKAFIAASEQNIDLAWKFLDKIYANQKQLRVPEDKLTKFAKAAKLDEATTKNKQKLLGLYLRDNLFKNWVKQLGGDEAAFVKALDGKDKEYQDVIQRDMQLSIKEVKLEGTPTLLVGKREGDTITAWKLQGISVDAVKDMIQKKKLLKLPASGKKDDKAKK